MAKLQQNDVEVLLPLLTLKSPEDSIRSSPASHWGSVIDSIYAQQQSNFISRLATPVEAPKQALEKIQKVTLFSYPDPKKKTYSKEDAFFNPTAIYLSRKPLTYNRNFRKNSMIEEKVILISPKNKEKPKKKPINLNNRKSLALSQEYDPLQVLKHKEKDDSMSKTLYRTSNTMREKEKILEQLKEKKALREEVFKRIEKKCKDFEKFRNVTPKIQQAKKIVDEYRENITWTASVLENCNAQESEVLKQMFMLTDYARNEMNKDIVATAEQIKRGVMEPAIKHRLSRKRSQFV